MNRQNYLDAIQLKEMFIAGAVNLERNKEMINNLNVFPIPDGDTGSNMSLTVMSASKELKALQEINYETFAKALSTGALMGARGNSGVILSQLFRGMSAVIEKTEVVDQPVFAEAMSYAVEIAYKAVIKPVEGTILTVARSMRSAAQEALRADLSIEDMLSHMIREGYKTLEKTPDMLAVLKQAGVVDAGAMGLLILFQGAEAYLKGIDLADGEDLDEYPEEAVIRDHANLTEADIVYPYCTEFFVRGLNLNREIITHELGRMSGDSLVVVVQDDMAKIHMHAENPGRVLDYAAGLGSLHDIKIENMREQYDILNNQPRPWKDVGFLAVVAGEGLKEIARSMGVDHIVSGGQTMNPSTEDLVAGVKEVHARLVYVLPNNKNIIMAAEQADHFVPEIDVRVIPSKSFPQGLSALIAYNPEKDPHLNETTMKEALQSVRSGEVTYAVRDTSFDGTPIREGSIIGMADGKIAVLGEDVQQTTLELVRSMFGDEEIITLYYGEEVSEEQAGGLAAELEKLYPNAEVEYYFGGQPLYYYLVSLE